VSRLPSRKETGRCPKNVVIIVTEGDTERIFFNGLKQRHLNIEIKPEKGKRTNARQLVEYCVKRIKADELDIEGGDIAICAFDVDNNTQKDLMEALKNAEKNGIIVALSNPCFELWYLLHFRGIDHRVSSKEIQSELSKHIRNYDKTEDYRELLTPRRRDAFIRAKEIVRKRGMTKLAEYIVSSNNPCTSVHIALDAIEKLVKKNR